MSRIRLDSISSLIFYKDTLTASRRAPAVQQLKCLGEPCQLYRPDVVRCVSLGGSDTDVSWKVRTIRPHCLQSKERLYATRNVSATQTCLRLFGSAP